MRVLFLVTVAILTQACGAGGTGRRAGDASTADAAAVEPVTVGNVTYLMNGTNPDCQDTAGLHMAQPDTDFIWPDRCALGICAMGNTATGVLCDDLTIESCGHGRWCAHDSDCLSGETCHGF